jgi:IS5 family transposase
MIREPNYNQLSFEEFKTPFERGLDKTNRWIILASLLPWDRLAKIYTRSLSKKMGRPAVPARVAVGAVIIKHKMSLADEEVIPSIQENPYFQYFLGFSEFSHDEPFDPSLFVTIRKRLGVDAFEEMTDELLATFAEIEKNSKTSKKKTSNKSQSPESSSPSSSDQPSKNVKKDEKHSGTLLLDATVAPADIKYPTDLRLLADSRKYSEALIDDLWERVKTPELVKPRTYRQVAQKDYMNITKKRKKKPNELRKAIRKQLNYLRRNITTINELLDRLKTSRWPLTFEQLRLFWIIQEVYRQQQQMYNERSKKIPDRIVSIPQPHVRPIIRGKAGKDVEFGAKLSASFVNGYAFLDRVSWDNYHEASDLPLQVEQFKKRFGYYPEKVITDRIYRTRENRAYLDKRGILFSAKPLGRPPKMTPENKKQLKALGKQLKKDSGIRSQIEGSFGVGKRAYDLDLVKAKLPQTSESWIATIFFVMTLARWLRDYFFAPVLSGIKTWLFGLFLIVKERYHALYRPVFI